MLQLQFDQIKPVVNAIKYFRHWFSSNVADFFEKEGLGDSRRRPSDWIKLFDKTVDLLNEVSKSSVIISISDEYLPLLKRALIVWRRAEAVRIQELQEKTHHLEVLGALDKDIQILDDLCKADWFSRTAVAPIPRVADLIPVQRVESFIVGENPLSPRKYDEKFHILLAPELFLTDLEIFRKQTDLRGTVTAVAFIDIDNFKAFNTKYSETKVDRNILPRFMQLLEAHVHFHGAAYRQGGDEYLLLIPGLSSALSLAFLEELRQKIAKHTYPQIERSLTVSIGVCFADPECHLTNRELQQMANFAKERAKGTPDEKAKGAGKNRIAYYPSNSFRESDLVIYTP